MAHPPPLVATAIKKKIFFAASLIYICILKNNFDSKNITYDPLFKQKTIKLKLRVKFLFYFFFTFFCQVEIKVKINFEFLY